MTGPGDAPAGGGKSDEARRAQNRSKMRRYYARHSETILTKQRAQRAERRAERDRLERVQRETLERRRREEQARRDTPRAAVGPDSLRAIDRRLEAEGLPPRRPRAVSEKVRRAHESDARRFIERWTDPKLSHLRQLRTELVPSDAQRRDEMRKSDRFVDASVTAQARLPELRAALVRAARVLLEDELRDRVALVNQRLAARGRRTRRVDDVVPVLVERVVDNYLRSPLADPIQNVDQEKFIGDVAKRKERLLTAALPGERPRARPEATGPVVSPTTGPAGPSLSR
ncbi:hypothetical protein [Microbacterium karelineae]|uniref:hypothetical protein n=1 Tax=Microbacterium karelineae TaxID=2654283 RepID=UPI0012EA4210|nr:hypothetical protein [Microbacterium karelineae]